MGSNNLNQLIDQVDDQSFFAFSVPSKSQQPNTFNSFNIHNKSLNKNRNSLIIMSNQNLPTASPSINLNQLITHPHHQQQQQQQLISNQDINQHQFSFSIPPRPPASSSTTSTSPVPAPSQLTPNSVSNNSNNNLRPVQISTSANDHQTASTDTDPGQPIQPTINPYPSLKQSTLGHLKHNNNIQSNLNLRPQTSAFPNSNGFVSTRPYGRMSYPEVIQSSSQVSNQRPSLNLATNIFLNSSNSLGIRPMTAPGPTWNSSSNLGNGEYDFSIPNSAMLGNFSYPTNSLHVIDPSSPAEIFGPLSAQLDPSSSSSPNQSSTQTTVGKYPALSTTHPSTASSSLSSSPPPPSSSSSSSSLPAHEKFDSNFNFHNSTFVPGPPCTASSATNSTTTTTTLPCSSVEVQQSCQGSEFQYSYDKLSEPHLPSSVNLLNQSSAYLQPITNQQQFVRPSTHAGTMAGFGGGSQAARLAIQNDSIHNSLGYRPSHVIVPSPNAFNQMPMYSSHRPLSFSQQQHGPIPFGSSSHVKPVLAEHHQLGIGSERLYNFNILPGAPRKRARRRFDEVERLYDCNYPGCTKAYGTLNHLNAHITMQKHGPKRMPQEFKEIRKEWRARKKAEAEARSSNKKFSPPHPSPDFQSQYPLARSEEVEEGDIRPHTAIGASGDHTIGSYQPHPRFPLQLSPEEEDSKSGFSPSCGLVDGLMDNGKGSYQAEGDYEDDEDEVGTIEIGEDGKFRERLLRDDENRDPERNNAEMINQLKDWNVEIANLRSSSKTGGVMSNKLGGNFVDGEAQKDALSHKGYVALEHRFF